MWLVLPLFALANAGVHFDDRILDTISNPISLGIIGYIVLSRSLPAKE